MKNLQEYIEESLLKESLLDDLDHQPEINDLLFSYIFNFHDENQYIKAIDYLIASSKLIKKNHIKQNSVCFMFLNKDVKNGKIVSPVIIIGIMDDELDKSIMIYWNTKTQSVERISLSSCLSRYIGRDEFKNIPLYELKSNTLINGFKKLNY